MRSFLSLILFAAFPALLLAQDKPVAVVVSAQGDRAHIRNGEVLDLEPSDLIRAGEEIQTGADGKVAVQASTGVIFQIGPASHVRILDLVQGPGSSSSSLTADLQTGSIATIVGKTSGANNVKIQTPTAAASVRGTEFLVEAADDETSITVGEGEVEVEDKTGTKAHVRPGGLIRARLREKLREEKIDERRRERLKVLNEFRARRDEKFHERIAKLRSSPERTKKRREAIKRVIEQRKEAKEERKEKREERREKINELKEKGDRKR